MLTVAYRMALVYWFIRRPKARGAYLAIWVEQHLLLIKNSYKAGLTLPAGGVKEGESPAEAAAREALEEVGIKVNPDQLEVADEFYNNSEYKHDYSTVFEIEFVSRPDVTIDRREVDWADWVHESELTQQPLNSIARQYVAWHAEHERGVI